jgi:hypothetical protein
MLLDIICEVVCWGIANITNFLQGTFLENRPLYCCTCGRPSGQLFQDWSILLGKTEVAT